MEREKRLRPRLFAPVPRAGTTLIKRFREQEEAARRASGKCQRIAPETLLTPDGQIKRCRHTSEARQLPPWRSLSPNLSYIRLGSRHGHDGREESRGAGISERIRAERDLRRVSGQPVEAAHLARETSFRRPAGVARPQLGAAHAAAPEPAAGATGRVAGAAARAAGPRREETAGVAEAGLFRALLTLSRSASDREDAGCRSSSAREGSRPSAPDDAPRAQRSRLETRGSPSFGARSRSARDAGRHRAARTRGTRVCFHSHRPASARDDGMSAGLGYQRGRGTATEIADAGVSGADLARAGGRRGRVSEPLHRCADAARHRTLARLPELPEDELAWGTIQPRAVGRLRRGRREPTVDRPVAVQLAPVRLSGLAQTRAAASQSRDVRSDRHDERGLRPGVQNILAQYSRAPLISETDTKRTLVKRRREQEEIVQRASKRHQLLSDSMTLALESPLEKLQIRERPMWQGSGAVRQRAIPDYLQKAKVTGRAARQSQSLLTIGGDRDSTPDSISSHRSGDTELIVRLGDQQFVMNVPKESAHDAHKKATVWFVIDIVHQRLCSFIGKVMHDQAEGSDWKDRIPREARIRCERDRDQWGDLGGSSASLLSHMKFKDLSNLICSKENWRPIFEPVFKDQTIVRGSLSWLNKIRNNVAHGRSVGKSEVVRLFSEAMYISAVLKEAA